MTTGRPTQETDLAVDHTLRGQWLDPRKDSDPSKLGRNTSPGKYPDSSQPDTALLFSTALRKLRRAKSMGPLAFHAWSGTNLRPLSELERAVIAAPSKRRAQYIHPKTESLRSEKPLAFKAFLIGSDFTLRSGTAFV